MDSNPTPPPKQSKTNFRQNKDIDDNSSQNSDSAVMGIGSKKVYNKASTELESKKQKSVGFKDQRKN